jgi:hypothetical protein
MKIYLPIATMLLTAALAIPLAAQKLVPFKHGPVRQRHPLRFSSSDRLRLRLLSR